jgi:MFS family permease
MHNPIRVALVKTHSRSALDALAATPQLAAGPIALLFFGGLLDTYVGARSAWLAVLVGLVKGLGWGFVVSMVQALSPTARRLTMLGLALTMGLVELSLMGGLVTALALAAVPLLELGGAAPAFVRAQGQTWLVTQVTEAVMFLMAWVALSALAPLLLGAIPGALLAAVVAGPLAHLWALQRADWCRPSLPLP